MCGHYTMQLTSGSGAKSQSTVEDWLRTVPAYTLHKPIRKTFPRLATIVFGPQQQLQVNLVDYQALARFNDG